MRKRKIISRDYLYNEHITKNRSIRSIAKELEISITCVTNNIKRYGLYKNIRDKYDDILTEEFLIENYINQKKSLTEISKEIGAKNKKVVSVRLKKYNIKLENRYNSKTRLAYLNSRKRHHVISSDYFNSIKGRAKRFNLDFNLTIEYIYNLFLNQNSKCALSGLELSFTDKSSLDKIPQTASLDRIDSSKGYTLDNVQWVHKDVNIMKSNIPNNKFIDICEMVSNNKDMLNIEEVVKYNKLPNSYMCSLIHSAKKRNIEFNITEEYLLKLLIKQNYKCSLSGIDLIFLNKNQTASLDRIDSSKGYVEGNLQWVEKTINRMKWILNQEDFIKICKLIVDNNK